MDSQNTLVVGAEATRYIRSEYAFRVLRVEKVWKLQLWIAGEHTGYDPLLINIFESNKENCEILLAHITRSIFEQRDEKLICINIPNIAIECLG